jgi:hypothetical protein
MELLEPEDKWHTDKPKSILPKREYAKEDSEKFFDDVEDLLDAKKEEVRREMAEEEALQKVEFRNTLDRWLENKEVLAAIQDGSYVPPEPPYQLHWGKVAYTSVLQLSSLTVAILCIIIGIWPAILATIPLFLGLNLAWLLIDEKENDKRRL